MERIATPLSHTIHIVSDRTWSEGDCQCFEWGRIEVVKSFRMLLGTEGGCLPAIALTLKSVEIRVWGFRE